MTTRRPRRLRILRSFVERRFYNGMRFHRAFPEHPGANRRSAKSPWTPRIVPAPVDPAIPYPTEIGRSHVRGAVAMARLPDNINPSRVSNGSQFYVCLTSMPKLDGKYTVFGEVLEGLDVLDSISNQPTDSNDFPLAKIVIKSISIQPRFAEAPAQ